MDAFKLGLEEARSIREKYDADFDVEICHQDDVPSGDRFIETGITFLRQQDPARLGELLEIRGYDKDKKPFSCKFRMHKGQSLMMRAVSGHAHVNKFAVEQVDEFDTKRSPYKLRDSHQIFNQPDDVLLGEAKKWLEKLDGGYKPTKKEEERLRVLSKELRARLADGYKANCIPRDYNRKTWVDVRVHRGKSDG